VLDLQGSDLTWNPSDQKLYVAVSGAASTNPGTITIVDPIAGTITSARQLSSAPSGFAISDDNHYLYTVTDAGAEIQRFVLPAVTPDLRWSLGTDSDSGKPNLAGGLKVRPGAARTLAVSLGEFGTGAAAIFDDAVRRPAVAGGGVALLGNSLQWKPDGSALYAAYTVGNPSPYYSTTSDDALFSMPVDDTGLGVITKYDYTFRSEGVHLQLDPNTGYVYGDWGEAVNAVNGAPAGNYRYTRPYGIYFPGPLSVVDPGLKRFYTL
jgi:hypothetical protein